MKILLGIVCLALAGGLVAQHWRATREENLRAAQSESVLARVEAVAEVRGQALQVALAAARQAAAADAARADALQRELDETRRRLAAVEVAAAASEKRLAVLTPPGDGVERKTELLKGSFTRLDEFRIYSPDAQLKVGRDVLISSPAGLMLSDGDLGTVAGDLAVETPSGRFEATHAFVDVTEGKVDLTADHVSFTNK